MRNYQKYLVYVVFVCGLAVNSSAQRVTGGRPGMLFRYGGSARAMALGGAFCAISGDGDAIFNNPAGLAGNTSKEIGLLYSNLLYNTRYSLYNFTYGLGKWHFGFALISLSTRDFSLRNNVGENIGAFTYTDNGVILGSGLGPYILGDFSFSLGANYKRGWKVMSGDLLLDSFDGQSAGYNLGGLVEYLWKNNIFRAGIVMGSYGEKFAFSNPTSNVIFGLLYARIYSKSSLALIVDIEKNKFKELSLYIYETGVEYNFSILKTELSLRGGVNIENELNFDQDLSFGFGLSRELEFGLKYDLSYTVKKQDISFLKMNEFISLKIYW